MKHKPLHAYEMIPVSGNNQLSIKTQPQQINIKSKADRLRELKQLFDEKLITQEDYDREKQKILDEDSK